MSQERFDWLASVAGETIKTPGSESNVKEIFDKCWELRESGQDLTIFNQFDEFGNYLWHHEITGPAVLEVLERIIGPKDKFCGFMSATGSAGTIACGDFLKKQFPTSKIVASEALLKPFVTINDVPAEVTGSVNNWRATREMADTDVDGMVYFNVSYTDVSGEAGVDVDAVDATVVNSIVEYWRTPRSAPSRSR